MPEITPAQVKDALEMLSEHYRQTGNARVPGRGMALGMRPTEAIDMLMGMPDVLRHLARTLNTVCE